MGYSVVSNMEYDLRFVLAGCCDMYMRVCDTPSDAGRHSIWEEHIGSTQLPVSHQCSSKAHSRKEMVNFVALSRCNRSDCFWIDSLQLFLWTCLHDCRIWMTFITITIQIWENRDHKHLKKCCLECCVNKLNWHDLRDNCMYCLVLLFWEFYSI